MYQNRFKSIIFTFLTVLICTGIVQASELRPSLTSAEQKWLAEHPRIDVGIMSNWPPMNYIDNQGVPRGIGVDYLNANQFSVHWR